MSNTHDDDLTIQNIQRLLTHGRISAAERKFLSITYARLVNQLRPFAGTHEWFDAIFKRNFERRTS